MPGGQSEDGSSSGNRPPRPPAIHVEDAAVAHPSYHRSTARRHPAEGEQESRRNTAHPADDAQATERQRQTALANRARSQSTAGAQAASRGRIGQYEILQTLGTGSFSKVKMAVHSATGHKVAMKIIDRAKLQGSGDMGARVKREIQYLKVLRHPHIIKLYEVITTPTDIIMVIEYAGGELFNYIVERGRMPEDDARRFFQQIICAIEYTHEHKIVHRDLKPENLLLDDFLNVKIADFGLSNSMLDGSFMSTSCGSPNYAAPEVISGKLYAGPEIDIWSCGVILYVMLCGRLPFDDEYIPTLFKKINGGIYSLPTFLSTEARQLLSAMLVVDPVKRITIQEIRALPWFQKNLPDYLRPLSRTDDDEILFGNDTASGEDDQARVAQEHKLDSSIIDELEAKMKGTFTRSELELELKREGTNQVKVSYQLIRDHRRMLNERDPDRQRATPGNINKNQAESNDGPSQNRDRANTLNREPRTETPRLPQYAEYAQPSNIGVLGTSLPGQNKGPPKDGKEHVPAAPSTLRNSSRPDEPNLVEETQAYGDAHERESNADKGRPRGGSRSQGTASPHTAHAVMPSSTSTTGGGPGTSAVSPVVHRSQSAARRAHRPRWHFGIRSRSPPMEVMGEIYRVLGTLGMEWKTRKRAGSIAEASEEAAAEDPYFIQARVRVRGVTIRLDLQLYQVEEGSYLVDFKHVSNPRGKGTLENVPQQHAGETSTEGSAGGTPTNTASRSRRSSSNAHGGARSGSAIRYNSFGETVPLETHTEVDVVSPFLFFEIATRLITELAVAA